MLEYVLTVLVTCVVDVSPPTELYVIAVTGWEAYSPRPEFLAPVVDQTVESPAPVG